MAVYSWIHVMKWILLATLVSITTGCATTGLQNRVVVLEQRVEKLNQEVAKLRSPENPAPPENSEQIAGDMLKSAQEAVNQLDGERAKTLLDALVGKYGATSAARYASRLRTEVEVLGKPAGEMDVEYWFNGQSTMNEGSATLLVFWEEWCPHCRRELPNLQKVWQENKDKGLNLVGLTKLSRSSTDEKVNGIIAEHGLTYPIGKERAGAMSKHFSVSGVPAAAIVKDGHVVWRGHPARISEEVLKKVLE